jgi:hypothetical protein
MAPIVHGLEAEYYDQIHFVYLNIDDPSTDGFKAQLGYFVQPDFFLLDGDGKVLNRWTGPVPADELEAAFAVALEG